MPLKDFPIWTRPRHHLDVEGGASNHVHWVELFYDLVHVVTIFLLGNYLSHHLDWSGFWTYTFVFIAIFFAWADNSIYNSLYISTDIPHRVAMAVQIVTMMFIAAAIPEVAQGGWPFFALGYALNRALTAWLYWRARHIGALAYWVFGAGVVMIQLQYLLPGIGTLRFERFLPRLGHLSERFGLLMLILLGEGFFKLCVTLADKGIDEAYPGTFFNLVMGGLSLFALAWIYFDSAGMAKLKTRAVPLMLCYWFAHIVILWAAVTIGVALAGEVYVGFLEPYPPGYGALGTIGLAAFLAALWVLQLLVEGRDETRRYHSGGLRLFGVAMAVFMYFIHAYVPAIIGNLGWGIALFSQIGVPLYRAVRDLRAPSPT